MKISRAMHVMLGLLGGVCISTAPLANAAVSQVPAEVPLFVNASTPPLNLLVVGRDHKLYYPAYNDASDLDGDGAIEFHFKPSITYFGYFDSAKCYSYNSSPGGDNSYFVPVGPTTTTAGNSAKINTCTSSSGRWSGNFLNYQTTSRIDALRKVLYGGYRTNVNRTLPEATTPTILERTYVRADAHTWGKQYQSILFDGYDLADYTPLTAPTTGNYTLFVNTNTSVTGAPKFRILTNVANLQINGWISREVIEGQNTQTLTNATTGANSTVNYTPNYDLNVRVQVCVSGLLESNCTVYPNGNYKPTGILHSYGQANQMYFGLMTGTYTNNLSGGVLRKAVSSFTGEVDPTTGIFGTATTTAGVTTYAKQGIIATLDALRIQDPNLDGNYTNCTTDASCMNWGNPLGEIMYESLRYFSGATVPTSSYASGANDTAINLPSVTPWIDPYSTTSGNTTVSGYPSCSKPFDTVISDVNPNFDTALPGSPFGDSITADTRLSGLNVATLGQTIWTNEVGGTHQINIGQSGTTITDNAPTAKSASSFGSIRGLPEEPAKQGTYNAASVAYYGNTHPITSAGSQTVKTFSIALSSTLPKFQMPVGGGTITILPYGRVVNTGSGVINTGGVTEEIVGFYIVSINNMAGGTTDSTVNGGRPSAVFRVIYDDSAAGADYDEDETVRYNVTVNGDNTVSIVTTLEYASAGYESHIGYTISGSTNDGIYLEITGGGSGNTKAQLDTPGTLLPGACAVSPAPSTCVTPTSPHTRVLTPSTSSSSLITNLQNPLWYAAKWGGFGTSGNTSSSLPVTGQWDSNVSGTPDNYFLVTNATTLGAQLSKAFNQILQVNNAVTAPAVSPSLSDTSTIYAYSTSFSINQWSGDLIKTTATVSPNATLTNLWTASTVVPTWSSRNILMANASVNTMANTAYGSSTPPTASGTGLQAFTYGNLSGLSYAGSAFTNTLTSANMVNFIRGDTSNAATYRSRASLIGDIVNSSPKYVGPAQYLSAYADALDGSGTYAAFKTTQSTRRTQVYVGANDGMLHGFDATTGVEKFAFIPTAVINNLAALTASSYNTSSGQHQYYVDGSPVVADVYFASAWHTVLIGTLGGGGSEVFALDITDPDNIKLLWEYTAQNDSRLGYTFATPIVSKLHDGHWGVITGNGYNSANGSATLFVLDVATGTRLAALVATTPAAGSDGDGLSSPRVADTDGDGIADYVYAGDLLGNMWRFDLFKPGIVLNGGAAADSDFKVGLNGTPLYTAHVSDTSGALVQSITAPPTLVRHPSQTGLIVTFGTGRFFTTTDKTNKDLQDLYGIWDQSVVFGDTTVAQNSPAIAAIKRANLQPQTITSQSTTTFGTNTDTVRLVSQNSVNWTTQQGWYLDLDVASTLVGERLVDPMVLSSGVLFVSTRTPSSDPCTPNIQGWIYGLDPTTGGATTFNVFNFSATGTVNSADSINGAVVSGFSTNGAGGFSISGNQIATSGIGSAGSSLVTKAGNSVNDGRQTWRIIPAN